MQRHAPFAVPGLAPMLARSYERLEDGITRGAAGAARAGDRGLACELRDAPPTLEELAKAGLVDRSYLLDPWRRPFHYEPGPDGYLLSAVDEGGRSRPDARSTDATGARAALPVRVVRLGAGIPLGLAEPAVTIGNFDGVHRGHQALVERGRRSRAQRRSARRSC